VDEAASNNDLAEAPDAAATSNDVAEVPGDEADEEAPLTSIKPRIRRYNPNIRVTPRPYLERYRQTKQVLEATKKTATKQKKKKKLIIIIMKTKPQLVSHL